MAGQSQWVETLLYDTPGCGSPMTTLELDFFVRFLRVSMSVTPWGWSPMTPLDMVSPMTPQEVEFFVD